MKNLASASAPTLPVTVLSGFFVYRNAWTFHPARYMDMLNAGIPGVLRAKGYLWLASRMDCVGSLAAAGGSRESLALDACLLQDDEFTRGPEAWLRMFDPFPSWSLTEH
jgi:Cobalamin synthesis protein cobW C-terminal domain